MSPDDNYTKKEKEDFKKAFLVTPLSELVTEKQLKDFQRAMKNTPKFK